MLIKIGRLRLSVMMLPRIPHADDSETVINLRNRIERRKARHQATKKLERRMAIAKFKGN
jgi:hypothetical protein